MSFIVHAPYPYCHRSGGIRALYKLADELGSRGQRVSIASLGPAVWGEDESPYSLDVATAWSDEERAEAIHVVPEIVSGLLPGIGRVVRWLLGPRRYQPGRGDLEVTWLVERDPDIGRLIVDLIEPDLFYPKTEPGEGVLCWEGKGHLTQRHGREITHASPASRAELGDLLRSAELLISADGNSSLNLEATICGTPVLLQDTEDTPTLLFGSSGLARDRSELDDAYRTVSEADEWYAGARLTMALSIDRFIDQATDHFGIEAA